MVDPGGHGTDLDPEEVGHVEDGVDVLSEDLHLGFLAQQFDQLLLVVGGHHLTPPSTRFRYFNRSRAMSTADAPRCRAGSMISSWVCSLIRYRIWTLVVVPILCTRLIICSHWMTELVSVNMMIVLALLSVIATPPAW